MRHILPLALLLASPVQAEIFTLEAPISVVTLHPDGASVQRLLYVDLPPGRHEIEVVGLPPGFDGETLSFQPGPGVTLGATSLFRDRQPRGTAAVPSDVAQARDQVKALEAALRATDGEIALIRSRAEAARAELAALQALTVGAEGPLDPTLLRALSAEVGAVAFETLERATLAETAAREAEVAREDEVKALAEAEAALAALQPQGDGADPGPVLVLAVESQGGPAEILFESLTAEAAWAPSYDLNLVEKPAPTLHVTRALRLWQNSGEDWHHVMLKLSTGAARGANAPDPLQTDPRQIFDATISARPTADAPVAEPMVTQDADTEVFVSGAFTKIAPSSQGLVVTYSYPDPVTLLTGAGETRLQLDELAFTPEIFALATPLTSENAYVMAEVKHSGAEPLLPGPARFYRDGALVGSGHLDLWPRGVSREIGFGPLESLTLRRDTPERSEGDSGLFSSDSERREEIVITAENHSPRAWPLRLRDRVPYSEQDDLEITYQASPRETTRDLDGARGILEWRMDLAAGAKAEVVLRTTLRWPEGMVLSDSY